MKEPSESCCGGHCGKPTKPASEILHNQTGCVPSTSRISLFSVPKMDCPSEERMIRMALEHEKAITGLRFDLSARTLEVWHQGDVHAVHRLLVPLRLGVRLLETRAAETTDRPEPAISEGQERKVLWAVLAINACMFVIEATTGWIAESTGLIADSLDMFADAAVYGVSLYAVGRALHLKQRAAQFAGLLQLILALGALTEVVRRFAVGSDPQSVLMMAVSGLALIANVSCLLLIARHRESGVHMKASWIFSANDVLANAGVILAGALVAWTGSAYPDLIIGLIIATVVFSGAFRILRLRA